MNILTSFLASLAEFCHFTSITTITVCCFIMFCFILKYFLHDVLNGNHDRNSSAQFHNQIPQVLMEKMQLPFYITNISSVSGDEEVRFQFQASSGPILFRAYWGVSVKAFHHVLKGPWPWFHDAFLHGNLFGESACIGLGELTTITSDPEKPVLDLSEVKPNGTELNLGPAPRQTFPLVLCGLAKQDQGDLIGAVLSVVHIKDEICSIGTHILATYVKHKQHNSVATHLVPLYTNTEENGESVCAVCQELPVTRVILPCKHACACRRCFEKLNSRWCPMCRTFIQSYFVTGREESDVEETVDSDASALNDEQQNSSWRQRLNNLNHRHAMAMGLQEN